MNTETETAPAERDMAASLPDASHIRSLAQSYGPEALEKLVAIMRDGTERSALSAAQTILTRAYGMPNQAVQHSGQVDQAPIIVCTGIDRAPNGTLPVARSIMGAEDDKLADGDRR